MLINLDLEAGRQERVESLNQGSVAMKECGNAVNDPWGIDTGKKGEMREREIERGRGVRGRGSKGRGKGKKTSVT